MTLKFFLHEKRSILSGRRRLAFTATMSKEDEIAMDRSYVIENQRERQRLEALVRRLDDRALASPMDAGGTVAAVLGHLAFWDQRIVLLTEQFRAGGDVNPMNERDVDWINDAAKPMMLAMPPRQLAELAISIAAAA